MKSLLTTKFDCNHAHSHNPHPHQSLHTSSGGVNDQAKTFSRVESNPQQQSQSSPQEKKQNNPKDSGSSSGSGSGSRRLHDNDNIASRSHQNSPFNHENDFDKGSAKRQAHKSVLDGTCPSCPPSKFKLKDALHYFWRGQVRTLSYPTYPL